jgi:hypothetical protein
MNNIYSKRGIASQPWSTIFNTNSMLLSSEEWNTSPFLS